jgi:ribose 5-phosphate isomerase A
MIVVADDSKLVDCLGSHAPLPVEIVLFGWQTVLDRLAEAGAAPSLRKIGGEPFVTDGGNYIADCAIANIADPVALEKRLATLVGVVETGLFISLASEVVVGGVGGITTHKRPPAPIVTR